MVQTQTEMADRHFDSVFDLNIHLC